MKASSHFITAPDGLKLHVRSYGPRAAQALPVVCLPGLTRTSLDFEVLASALAHHGDRRVIAVDYRGRGLSDYDSDPDNYTPATELSDLLAVLAALEVEPAVFVGTSRGGILAMLLATIRPAALAGVVLNDIGPVIECDGLLRIKSYVGGLPQPTTFHDGAGILRDLFGAQFPKLPAADWLAFAQRTFKQESDGLKPTYDVRLAKTLEHISAEQMPPPLWDAFDALARIPVMVIRGANSDVLSAATVAAMAARRPDLEIIEVPDQGHPPLLVEDEIIRRIDGFVVRCSRQVRPQEKPPAETAGG